MTKMNLKSVRVLMLLGVMSIVAALVSGCAAPSPPPAAPPPSEQEDQTAQAPSSPPERPTVPAEEKQPEPETGGIAGTYVREHYPDEYLELHQDGTFHLRQMEYGTMYDATGEWEVEGNELWLYVKSVFWDYPRMMEATHVVATLDIKANKLIDPDGEAWVKR